MIVNVSADYTPITDYFYGDSEWTNLNNQLNVPFECDSNTYVFRANEGNLCFYAISTSQNARAVCSNYIRTDGTPHEGFTIICDLGIGQYWYGFGGEGISATLVDSVACNYFTGSVYGTTVIDTDKLIADFTTFLGEQPLTHVNSFSIPAGWVAYFKTNSNINLSCVQPDYSMIGSNPFATNNQMYGFANSLPASGTTFPFSGMSNIPWQKGSNLNIFGQTRNSVAAINNGSIYTVVYNPTFQEGTGGSGAASDDAPNGAITISGSNISDIRIYPLSGQFLNTGNGYHFVSGSDSYDTDYVDGIIDSETGSVVFEDASGTVVVPNIGGQNTVPEIASIEGFFTAIKQILVGIANDLGTIFGFAYEAVVTLVSTASSFVATLGGLYAWLPSPISTVLISAITLAITIGVFKVFM